MPTSYLRHSGSDENKHDVTFTRHATNYTALRMRHLHRDPMLWYLRLVNRVSRCVISVTTMSMLQENFISFDDKTIDWDTILGECFGFRICSFKIFRVVPLLRNRKSSRPDTLLSIVGLHLTRVNDFRGMESKQCFIPAKIARMNNVNYKSTISVDSQCYFKSQDAKKAIINTIYLANQYRQKKNPKKIEYRLDC